MQHHFDIELAKRFGILEAVLLDNIQFWIKKNEANKQNYFDGSYWTYNSIHAFSELFPYASDKQIRTSLKKLVDEGLLKTGNYNKSAYDRTLWYALTEKGKSILPNGQMEATKRENGIDQEGEPIPYTNSDIKPNKKPNREGAKRFTPPTIEEVKAYCQERGNNVDPERFVDFYASKGWKVGNSSMKDWKASVRTWEKRDNESKPKHKVPSNYDLSWLDAE